MRAIVITLLISFSCFSEAIVIDHNATNITAIPKVHLESAKKSLHIAYGHTSHGSQLTTGMTGLIAFANGGGKGLNYESNFFAWNNGGENGALDLHDYAMDGDVGNYPQWVNNTTEYLGDPDPKGRGSKNPDVNVIIWSWCGQVDNKFAAGTITSEYLTPMDSLEQLYFGVTFIYMTGHLNYWADSDTKAGNQQIREFCKTNEKVLYDFADIESHDPEGNYYEFASDDCDYYDSDGRYQGNWAINWQESHTENIDWFSCESAHSEPLNANLKAYAAWNLWARLAGWNNSTEIVQQKQPKLSPPMSIQQLSDKKRLRIEFQNSGSNVRASITNLRGQEIRIFNYSNLRRGNQSLDLCLEDIAEGHYLFNLVTKEYTTTQIFTLIN